MVADKISRMEELPGKALQKGGKQAAFVRCNKGAFF